MTEELHRSETTQPHEILFDQYGVYLVTNRDAGPMQDYQEGALENPDNVVLVSQPDWSSTIALLEQGHFGRTTVITPELITVAGVPFADLDEHRSAVE